MPGFDDVDALGRDIDVALYGDDVAADLAVFFSGEQQDIAGGAPDGALGRQRGVGLLIGAVLSTTDREADPAAAKDAGLFGLAVVRFDDATDAGEIVAGGHQSFLPADASAQVADVFGGERNDLPASNAADSFEDLSTYAGVSFTFACH
ncbi:MAG: hypothetical protein IPN64_04510 [Propionivibrio sp.]|uniref:hypothetical protein n=1 Tax=Propionivibrio sp. TaxID=2212460 RepID=UPI0025E2FD71|nr:hypothetical protein [Propionivibrio sp.]MBK8893328.1 hypothetical protein [Propionivibrio sp.]